MASGLYTGFELDRRWHMMRGEMEETKKPALLQLARVLEAAGTAYAVIGGVAMQVHQGDPRTTLDVADAQGLLETRPALVSLLSAEERDLLDRAGAA